MALRLPADTPKEVAQAVTIARQVDEVTVRPRFDDLEDGERDLKSEEDRIRYALGKTPRSRALRAELGAVQHRRKEWRQLIKSESQRSRAKIVFFQKQAKAFETALTKWLTARAKGNDGAPRQLAHLLFEASLLRTAFHSLDNHVTDAMTSRDARIVSPLKECIPTADEVRLIRPRLSEDFVQSVLATYLGRAVAGELRLERAPELRTADLVRCIDFVQNERRTAAGKRAGVVVVPLDEK